MAERPGDTLRGRVVAVEDDVPASRDRETPSGMLSRAAEEGARRVLAASLKAGGEYVSAHPRAARVIRHVLMMVGVLGVGAGGFVAGDIADVTDDCDPLVLRHAMHMAVHGRELEKALRGAGNSAAADAVRDMTDPNLLPDDLRLCVLLERRQTAGGTP